MQRGFTVVEALIAATLLAAAVVSIAQLLAMSAQGALASRTATAALMAAEQKMEELRAASWAAVAASPAGTDFLDDNAQLVCRSVPPAPCPDAAYVRRWTAVAAPFTPSIVIIEVHVLPSGPAHGSALLVSAKAQRSR